MLLTAFPHTEKQCGSLPRTGVNHNFVLAKMDTYVYSLSLSHIHTHTHTHTSWYMRSVFVKVIESAGRVVTVK